MKNITIEKNIPLPQKINRRIYPFDKMKVKESFAITLDSSKKKEGQVQRVYMAMWRYSKDHPDVKFTSSSTNGELRVWRIK
jgi:hypothetical protein